MHTGPVSWGAKSHGASGLSHVTRSFAHLHVATNEKNSNPKNLRLNIENLKMARRDLIRTVHNLRAFLILACKKTTSCSQRSCKPVPKSI